MASGQVATLPRASYLHANARRDGAQLGKQELFEIQQYEKIIQLRNDVLEGNHPRIKLPAHLAEKVAASGRVPSPNLQPLPRPIQQQDHRANQSGNLHSFVANSVHVAAPGLKPGQALAAESGSAKQQVASRPFAKGNTEINPIFLEKSEPLIKAEIGLQRQRLERGLRDDLEEKKASNKANNSTVDPSSSFEIDVSEVLLKAMALVEGAATGNKTNNAVDDDTSFDENDYYSSRHDTPESRDKALSSDDGGVTTCAATASSRDALPTSTRPPAANMPLPQPNAISIPGLQSAGQYDGPAPNMLQPPFQSYDAPAPMPVQSTTGSANNSTEGDGLQGESTSRGDTRGNSSQESGEASRSDGAMDIDQDVRGHAQRFRDVEYAQGQRAPPLVRAHDLSPIAPQPAHVSPLAVAGRDLRGDSNLRIPQGTPAQVAALRNEGPGGSSPESSSPQAKAAKKKEKKKKRKAERLAQEAAATPYIKPEPRSPSPFTAPPLPRPSKRQRQAQRQQEAAAAHEEARFEQASGSGRHRYPLRTQQGDGTPGSYGAYERQEDPYYVQPSGSVVPRTGVYEREYIDDRRPAQAQSQTQSQAQAQAQYDRQRPPSRSYSVQYVGDGYVQPVSQPTSTRQYREAPQYYPEEHGAVYVGRPEEESVRTRSPVMMGPPRPPLTRVLVDTTGREYFEPHRPPMARQSVAPSVRQAEPEIIYERPVPVRHSVAPQMRPGEPEIIYERSAPVRTVSRRPGPVYEDDGVVYREPSSAYGAPRRVVTQPGPPPRDQRGYAQREYSVRPMGPPTDEYQHVERRPVADLPREYITRSASVRPAEPTRYEMPREAGSMVQNMRPEPPMREYATSVHPESRVEMMAPVGREYGRRPPEPHVVQRSYSVRPPERYYERPGPGPGPGPGLGMPGEEISYIGERQQRAREVVYVEDPRGEAYR